MAKVKYQSRQRTEGEMVKSTSGQPVTVKGPGKKTYPSAEPLNPGMILRDPSAVVDTYKPMFSTMADKLSAIRHGLQSDAIVDLLQLTGSTRSGLAHLLSLTEPTLRKYINEGKELNVVLSEHILLLFELFDKGIETFGELEEFKLWLNRQSVGLNEKPIEILDTITGIKMVMDELIRIDYGVAI